jgi:hypothetical protein
MAISYKNLDMQILQNQVRDESAGIVTRKKRMRTLLALYSSRRNRALVHKVIFGWSQSTDPEIADMGRKFQLEIRGVKGFVPYKRKPKESQPASIEPPKPEPKLVPQQPLPTPPAGATHIAPGSDGFMYYTNAEGKNFGRVPEGEKNVERRVPEPVAVRSVVPKDL